MEWNIKHGQSCTPRLLCCFSFKSSFFSYFQKLEKKYLHTKKVHISFFVKTWHTTFTWDLTGLIFIFSLGNFRFFLFIFHFLFVFIFIFIIKIKYCFENYLYYYPRIIINKYNKWWNIKLWFVIVFLKEKNCNSLKKI